MKLITIITIMAVKIRPLPVVEVFGPAAFPVNKKIDNTPQHKDCVDIDINYKVDTTYLPTKILLNCKTQRPSPFYRG